MQETFPFDIKICSGVEESFITDVRNKSILMGIF